MCADVVCVCVCVQMWCGCGRRGEEGKRGEILVSIVLETHVGMCMYNRIDVREEGRREGERREIREKGRREEGGTEEGKERGGGDEGDTKRHNLLVSTVFLMHCRATSPCWRPSFVNGASNTKLLILLARSNCVGLSRSVSSVKYGSMCVI